MSIFTTDVKKRLRFFDGTSEITGHVLADSFSCEDILSTDQLNIGECNAARVQFRTDIDLALAGKQIRVSYGTESESVTIGTYKVTYSSHKVNSTETNITAYDCVKEFDLDVSTWYLGLQFPLTAGSLRSLLCSHIGVQQVSRQLVNDGVVIQKTINPEKLKARDLLAWIGQINAVFPHATAEYTIDWIELGTEPIPVDGSVIIGPTSYEAKNYTTRAITGVTIRQEDGDVGATAGTKENAYYITANPLVYGLGTAELEPIAQSIYSKIASVHYTPCSVLTKYVPEYALGTMLSFRGNVFYNFGMDIDGVMHTTIKCDGNQALEDNVDLATAFEQIRGKSNVLSRSIEETKSTISDVERGLQSQIMQTSERIELQISEIQKELDGSINVYYTHEQPTLLNYPAWDFTYNIPCNNTVRTTDDLKFEYTAEYYGKNTRAIAYNLENDTSFRFRKSESGDSFFWEEISDTEFGVLASRITALEVKSGEISASVEEIYSAQSQQGEAITTLSANLSITAGQITSEVTRATGAENILSSRITQTANSLTSEITRATGAESTLTTRINQTDTAITTEVARAKSAEGSLSSRITQTAEGLAVEIERSTSAEESIRSEITASADEIKAMIDGPGGVNAQLALKVGKDDNNQIISMINASANVITLNANRLVVNSDNFTLSRDGKIAATGASISGNINALTGNIGGWAIGSGGITNGIPYLGHKDSNSTGMGDYGGGWAFWAGDGRFSVRQDGSVHMESAEIAGYATAADLSAATARIGVIEANYISAATVQANYMTAATVQANYATIAKVNADIASVQNLIASSVSVDNISAIFNSPSAGSLTLGTVRAANYWYYNGSDYQRLSLKQVRASNGTFWLLGA